MNTIYEVSLKAVDDEKASEETPRSSSLLKGFFYMNNFCFLNNCAAMSFKLLLQQGVSVFVLALFRNLVLLVVSLFAYLVFVVLRKSND